MIWASGGILAIAALAAIAMQIAIWSNGPAVVDADGKKLYVAMTDTGEMAVVDVFERKVLTTVPGVGPNPYQATLAVTNNYCH